MKTRTVPVFGWRNLIPLFLLAGMLAVSGSGCGKGEDDNFTMMRKTPANEQAVEHQKQSFNPEEYLEKWQKIFGKKIDTGIVVSVPEQKLYFIEKGKVRKSFPVSTSKYGTGSEAGSNKTPLGTHIIRQKEGDGAEEGIIFKSLINTRRKAEIRKAAVDAPEDPVTTRVMVLGGMEKGFNKGGNKDSFSRRIYIHGSPAEGLIGRPASMGCVRMTNSDVIELFDLALVGMPVEIIGR